MKETTLKGLGQYLTAICAIFTAAMLVLIMMGYLFSDPSQYYGLNISGGIRSSNHGSDAPVSLLHHRDLQEPALFGCGEFSLRFPCSPSSQV
jgi:hypothetical protein